MESNFSNSKIKKLDFSREVSEVQRNNLFFRRRKHRKNGLLKLTELQNPIKRKRKNFEPNSDNEGEEYIIEEFLSQIETHNKSSFLMCSSKFPCNKDMRSSFHCRKSSSGTKVNKDTTFNQCNVNSTVFCNINTIKTLSESSKYCFKENNAVKRHLFAELSTNIPNQIKRRLSNSKYNDLNKKSYYANNRDKQNIRIHKNSIKKRSKTTAGRAFKQNYKELENIRYSKENKMYIGRDSNLLTINKDNHQNIGKEVTFYSDKTPSIFLKESNKNVERRNQCYDDFNLFSFSNTLQNNVPSHSKSSLLADKSHLLLDRESCHSFDKTKAHNELHSASPEMMEMILNNKNTEPICNQQTSPAPLKKIHNCSFATIDFCIDDGLRPYSPILSENTQRKSNTNTANKKVLPRSPILSEKTGHRNYKVVDFNTSDCRSSSTSLNLKRSCNLFFDKSNDKLPVNNYDELLFASSVDDKLYSTLPDRGHKFTFDNTDKLFSYDKWHPTSPILTGKSHSVTFNKSEIFCNDKKLSPGKSQKFTFDNTDIFSSDNELHSTPQILSDMSHMITFDKNKILCDNKKLNPSLSIMPKISQKFTFDETHIFSSNEKIHQTSPILSSKSNTIAFDKKELFINERSIHSTLPKLPEGSKKFTSGSKDLFSSDNKWHPSSPILSSKSQNLTFNKNKIFVNKEKLYSLSISPESLQKNTFDNTDIMSRDSKLHQTSSILSHKSHTITFDKNNILCNEKIVHPTSPTLAGESQNFTCDDTDIFSSDNKLHSTSPLLSAVSDHITFDENEIFCEGKKLRSSLSKLLKRSQKFTFDNTDIFSSDNKFNDKKLHPTSPTLAEGSQNFICDDKDIFSSNNKLHPTSPILTDKSHVTLNKNEIFCNGEPFYSITSTMSKRVLNKRFANMKRYCRTGKENLEERKINYSNAEQSSPKTSRSKIFDENYLAPSKLDINNLKYTFVPSEKLIQNQSFEENILADNLSNTYFKISKFKTRNGIPNNFNTRDKEFTIFKINNSFNKIHKLNGNYCKGEKIISSEMLFNCQNLDKNYTKNNKMQYNRTASKCIIPNHDKDKKSGKSYKINYDSWLKTKDMLLSKEITIAEPKSFLNNWQSLDTNISNVTKLDESDKIEEFTTQKQHSTKLKVIHEDQTLELNTTLPPLNFKFNSQKENSKHESSCLNDKFDHIKLVNESFEKIIIEDFATQEIEVPGGVSTTIAIESQSSSKGNTPSCQVSRNFQTEIRGKNCNVELSKNCMEYDSPMKKFKKPKSGSLVLRMKKALCFQRSMFHMWNHNKESQEQNDFNLIVKKVWNEFGKVILNCKHSFGNQRNICEETKVSADIIVITDSVTAKQVVDDCFISIYPPWQSMMYKDINLIVVLNVTRLQVIRSTLEAVPPPLLSSSENKKFSCMCIEDNLHNFKLVDQGAEAILPLYKVDKFQMPVLLKTDEQTASTAIANSLSTQNLNVDVLHHFRRLT